MYHVFFPVKQQGHCPRLSFAENPARQHFLLVWTICLLPETSVVKWKTLLVLVLGHDVGGKAACRCFQGPTTGKPVYHVTNHGAVYDIIKYLCKY